MKKEYWDRITAWVLALLLLPALAFAEARYPAMRGPVTDDTNRLSRSVTDDIASFQALVQAQAGVNVYVALVHFLDGEDAQTYANNLLKRWDLGENGFLLLCAVGEDRFASAAGEAVKARLGESTRNLPFDSGFHPLFEAQDYDAAISRYLLAFADILNKQYAAAIHPGRLFSAYQQGGQATSASNTSQWGSVNSTMREETTGNFDRIIRDSIQNHERREREARSLTPSGWIVLVLLVVIILSQSNPVRKARRRGGCFGCGCGPLGWIFGLLGLGRLFRKRF